MLINLGDPCKCTLSSCQASVRRLSWPAHPLGCDDVVHERGVIRRYRRGKRLHRIILSLLYNLPLASAFLCQLFAVSTVTEPCQLPQRKNTPLVASLDTRVLYHSTCPEMSEWCDVGQFVVSVALVGLEWPTVNTVVTVIMNLHVCTVHQ